MQHTGRFEVKFKVQSRMIRGQHDDSSYVLYQIRLLKQFCVQWRDFCSLFWLDDKAIIPIGEPDLPVSTGVRAHNRSLAPVSASAPQLSALDHDFHVCGAIPSVAFESTIPSDASETFFQGTVHVTLKAKVFSPSHALRHGTEMVSLIRENYSADGVNADTPIIINQTDGGPDHRTTFGSVQLASIAQLILLDIDIFVTCHTAPMGSWANLAERANSIINLALQNVCLDRSAMEPEMENHMKRVSSLHVLTYFLKY